MKKKLVVALGISCTLLLSACGKSAQDEFVGYMESQSKQTQGTWTFKMSVEEFNVAESTASINPMVNMLATQVKDMSFTGSVKSDLEKEMQFAVDMTFNGFGMNIPFSMIGEMGKAPKMYFATDMMEYLMAVVSNMSGTDVMGEADLSQYQGKYVDLLDLNQDSLKSFTANFEESSKDSDELRKKQVAFIKALDTKTFTKKDGLLSHTFTKEEVVKIMKKVGEEDKDLEKNLDQFKELSAKVTIDPKKDNVVVKVTMEPVEKSQEKAGFESIVLAFETTLKDKKAEISMPKDSEILTKEEAEALFSPEAPADEEMLDYEITDEDFTELKTTIEANKDQFDEKTAKQILEGYKTILTDEQYKEIEAIFEK